MEYELIQGEPMARLGFGTWRLSGSACQRAVRSALELGYRHIDTAEMYGNEAEVARAIADARVPRKELFLTTKVWHTHLRRREVLRACEASLRALQVDAVDLYLVHWPDSSVPIEETMAALHELAQSGKTRYVGVSNFSLPELDAARAACPSSLFTNQVPYHVLRPQSELLDYCQKHDIMLTAYSPLGKGQLAAHPTLQAIGNRHAKSAAQVALRWLIQQPKVIAIPKASQPPRQRQNLEIFDFALSEAEMAEIGALGRPFAQP